MNSAHKPKPVDKTSTSDWPTWRPKGYPRLLAGSIILLVGWLIFLIAVTLYG